MLMILCTKNSLPVGNLYNIHVLGRFVIREEKKKNFSPSNNLIKKYKKRVKKKKRKENSTDLSFPNA